jgi:hypothetical protein
MHYAALTNRAIFWRAFTNYRQGERASTSMQLGFKQSLQIENITTEHQLCLFQIWGSSAVALSDWGSISWALSDGVASAVTPSDWISISCDAF